MLYSVDLEPAASQAQGLDERCLDALRAAQHGSDASHELPGAEGLDEVVVGARHKPRDALLLTGLSRQHEDGHVGAAADLTADLLSRDVGQHEVKDDQCGLHALGASQAVAAGPGNAEVVCLLYTSPSPRD